MRPSWYRPRPGCAAIAVPAQFKMIFWNANSWWHFNHQQRTSPCSDQMSNQFRSLETQKANRNWHRSLDPDDTVRPAGLTAPARLQRCNAAILTKCRPLAALCRLGPKTRLWRNVATGTGPQTNRPNRPFSTPNVFQPHRRSCGYGHRRRSGAPWSHARQCVKHV